MGKIIKAKLHSGVFLAGINLGDTLSSQPGAKQVDMLIEAPFLRVSKGTKAILVPFTNISQIEIEEVAKVETTSKK